jgi:hypothetical protein
MKGICVRDWYFILYNKLHKRLLELISVIKCFHIDLYIYKKQYQDQINYTCISTSKFI